MEVLTPVIYRHYQDAQFPLVTGIGLIVFNINRYQAQSDKKNPLCEHSGFIYCN